MQNSIQFFSEADFRARADRYLYKDVPPQLFDHNLRAYRSDDDLNAGLGPTFNPEQTSRNAAVLVPIIIRPEGLTVLLTRRSDELPSHPGQVAFPGGKIDAGDEGPVGAALRETFEETGLDAGFIDVLGFLDVYQTRTAFRICPVVAVVQPGFELRCEPGEVTEIFEVPLQFLMTPANHQKHSREWKGAQRQFYAMPYEDYYIWGATAGMLKNFYDKLYAPETA